jgi:hypothetical protein
MRSESEESFESEARIIFVGATRAKDRLLVGKSFMSYSSRLSSSGRAYTRSANPPWAAQVELGRAEDIFPEGLTGNAYFSDPVSARRAQTLIAGLRRGVFSVNALMGDSNSGYTYWVSLDGNRGDRILALNQSVNRDLFSIARNLRKRYPPRHLKNIRTLGVRTVVVSPGDPATSALHQPWSESGFMLAPLLVGYDTLEFKR